MLTIFGCPKPFTNPHIAIIQRNAITSWTLLRPQPEIILFGDEHVQSALAEALRARGVDVLTIQEAGNVGLSDLNQLTFSTDNKRSLFSYNRRHFAKIHYEWMKADRSHGGIILSDQLTIGVVLRRLMRLCFTLHSNGMKNRPIFSYIFGRSLIY